MKKFIKYAGIDYSMSCPALCIFEGGDKWDYKKCKFFYTTEKKRWAGKSFLNDKIEGFHALSKEYIDIDRINHLSDNFMDCIMDSIDDGERIKVGLEDYAFQGSGNMTLLAENMGVLKHKLRSDHHSFIAYSPATIKKFAREHLPEDIQRSEDGKLLKMGKFEMYQAFKHETGYDLLEALQLGNLLTKSNQPSAGNPITDIVDSYWIAKYHYVQNEGTL